MTVLVCHGSIVTLPCTTDVTNPSPSYYRERVPFGVSSSVIKQYPQGWIIAFEKYTAIWHLPMHYTHYDYGIVASYTNN